VLLGWRLYGIAQALAVADATTIDWPAKIAVQAFSRVDR
jgi:hypothetical protein